MTRFNATAVAPTDLPQTTQGQDTLLVDVPPRWHYRRAHIPGSHSIPAGLLLAGEWPGGDLLLIASDTAQATELMETLHDRGYNRRLLYLQGGFTAWAAQTSTHQGSVPVANRVLIGARQLGAGPALLVAAGLTQSLGLLALGLVLLIGPWSLRRSRA